MKLPRWTIMVLCQIIFNIVKVSAVIKAPTNLEPLPKPLSQRSSSPQRPVITEQPKDWLVETAEVNVRLNCRANGYPKPNITWLKDGVPLSSVSIRHIVRISMGELMFYRVRRKGEGANTGTYQCVATNQYGRASSRNASVQLASILDDFRKQPSDAVAAVGDSVTIECEGPRGIPEPDISWRKDNKRLSPRHFGSRMRIKPGGDLAISRLQKSDSGSYACVASNVAGEVRSTAALLRVQEPPRFTVRPSDRTIQAKQSVELQCDADGDPRPTMQWSRVGGNLPERWVPLSNGNMRISGARVEDSGEYVCTAVNMVGKQTASATITVQAGPQIGDFAQDTTVQFGDTVTLPCEVKGKPTPTIFWRKQSEGIEMHVDSSYQGGHLFVAANGNLIIYSARFDDEGLYVCQAVNTLGSVTGELKLTIQPRRTSLPPPVIRRAPSNTSAARNSDVELECSSSSIPQPDIRWFKDGRLVDSRSSHMTKQSSGNLKISNVQTTDAGQYTCKVSNDHGRTEWSAWLSVLAIGSPTTPTPKISDLPVAPGKPRIVNSTSSYITVTWKPSTYNGASPIQHYILEYYRIGGSSSTWTRISPVLKKTYKLRFLSASSDYVFVVRTVNRHGVSYPSPVSKYMRTLDLPVNPPLAPDSPSELDDVSIRLTQAVPLTTPGTGSGSIRLKWETSTGCDYIDGFRIVARPVTAAKSKIISEQVPCLLRAFDLTDIKSGIKYEVRVRPFKDQYSGPTSSMVLVSLQVGMINAPRLVLSTKTNFEDQNKIIFHWQAPQFLPSAYISNYVLSCWSLDGAVSRTLTVNSSTTEVTMTDLRSNLAYVATVTYSTPLGEGVKSERAEINLGATTSKPDEDGIAALLQQPGMIAGICAAILVIIGAIIGIYYYRRSRRNHKTRGLHGSHRSNARRYESHPPYMPGFEITTTGTRYDPERGLNMPGLTGQGDDKRLPNQQHSATNIGSNTNGGRNAMVSYNAKNGAVRSCVGEQSPVMTSSNQPKFSYVNDQLINKTDIQPHFTRPSLSSTQSNPIQQQRLQQDQFSRQRSANNFMGPNSTDQNLAFMTNNFINSTIPLQNEGDDLPPPPPSPPLSQRTVISERSHASSNMHSTGDRSSRSGQRSRRSARGNRFGNSSGVNNHPTDTDTGIDSAQNTPLAVRPDDLRGNGSPVPPTPPVRGASNFQYSHPSVPYQDNRDHPSNLGYLGGPSEEETDNENDHVSELHVRSFHGIHDPRSSMAVSNVSMMNGYGSDSDVRNSACDHESVASSDEEFFHTESASQVGQNVQSSTHKQPRFYKSSGNLPNKQYPNTYHPHQAYDEVPLLQENSGQSLGSGMSKSSKKQGGKNRRPKTSNTNINRLNSASSSSSSCRHNTGDSGMSAGAGCSTEHSSLNSSASGGGSKPGNSNASRHNAEGNQPAYDITPTNQNIENLPRLDISQALNGENAQDNGYPSPGSPTASAVSEHSGYVSTASTCWQFQSQSPSKQQHPPYHHQRVGSTGRSTGGFLTRPNNLSDTKNYPCNIKSKFDPKLPPQHHNNEDSAVYSAYDVTPTNYHPGLSQFQGTRMALGSGLGGKGTHTRPQELSDVPEVSTSDFCEDYSDQSQ